MKIGIDARLLTDNKTGIGTYTNRLITELAAVDKGNQYVLYTDKEHKFNLPDNFSIRLIPQRRRIIWTNLYLPRYLSPDNIDIFHSVANFEVPIMARCKIIVTIHDLIPLLYPELVPFRYRVLFRLLKGAFRLKALLAGDIGEIKRFARENKIIINDVVSYTSSIYSLSEQIEGSWLALKYKGSVSLFYYPHFNIPWFIPDKGIVTIHDLIHLHFPEYFGRLRVKMARQLFIRVCKKARRIIAVSESTRKI